MGTEEFLQRLRQADMDGDPSEDHLDQLIGTAVRKGRRRVIVRRSAGVIAACAIVAVSIGLGTTIIPGRSAQFGPAASPAPSTSTTARSPEPSTTPSNIATPTGSPEPVDAASVKKVLRTLLPDLTLADFSAANDEPEQGATALYFSATDDQGTVWMSAGIVPSFDKASFSCVAPTCTTTERAGGILYSVGDRRDPDKSGNDSSFNFERADGRVVQLFQQNFNSLTKKVTRTKLPLTDDQAIAFVTDPAWDDLAARCQPKGFAC